MGLIGDAFGISHDPSPYRVSGSIFEYSWDLEIQRRPVRIEVLVDFFEKGVLGQGLLVTLGL